MVDLKIENLTKKYGGTTALDRFSIDIKSGELMVLLEPSGCGKDYRNKVHSRIDTSYKWANLLGK